MDLNVMKLANRESGQSSQDFLNKVDSKLMIDVNKSQIVENDEWIDMVEFSLPHIEKALTKEIKNIVTEEEIIRGIRVLKPVTHRLELKRNANGSIIIDDAYNSNVKGAQMALEVLNSFKDMKKVLITPGIVDLGDKTEIYNKQFGKQAAKNSDYIILVGEKQAKPIMEGIKEEQYEEKNVFVASNLSEAIKKMNEMIDGNTVVLFENDLPDNYL